MADLAPRLRRSLWLSRRPAAAGAAVRLALERIVFLTGVDVELAALLGPGPIDAGRNTTLQLPRGVGAVDPIWATFVGPAATLAQAQHL